MLRIQFPRPLTEVGPKLGSEEQSGKVWTAPPRSNWFKAGNSHDNSTGHTKKQSDWTQLETSDGCLPCVVELKKSIEFYSALAVNAPLQLEHSIQFCCQLSIDLVE